MNSSDKVSSLFDGFDEWAAVVNNLQPRHNRLTSWLRRELKLTLACRVIDLAVFAAFITAVTVVRRLLR